MTTSPAVASTIVVDGVPRDQWGLTWLDLPAESYEVCFTDVPGYVTPSCETVEVVAGETTEVVGGFVRQAVLEVVTSPAVPSTVTVRDVDGGGVAVPFDKWGVFTHVAPGRTLEVCFGAVAGFTPPACQTVPAGQLGSGAFKQVTGVFTPDPAAVGPVGKGELRVSTSPAVPAQVVVDGVPRDEWGLDWLELDPGSYEVCFGDVPGFATPPCETAEVTAGATTVLVGGFEALGFLRAVTDPVVEATVGVAGLARNDWGFWFALAPGDHQVCWGPAKGSKAQPVPVCETATVSAGATTTVTGDYSAVPTAPTEISTAALPEGDARFVDSLVRDLVGRAPTEAELAEWTALLAGGTSRADWAATLVDRDEFLSMVVDNRYVTILDRLPTTGERTAGIAQVRADGATTALAAALFASDEFYALAESTNGGFVATAAQRVLHRDLWPTDFDPLLAALNGGSQSRSQVAAGLYGRDEAGQVRAKMWSQKLLSRNPTATEQTTWGDLILDNGDLAAVVTIAASDSYYLLAQQRFVQTTMTTAIGTVIAADDEVVSATYAADGTGTVVLAPGVVPPAVGNHLVVSDSADPAAGGIGKVTALAPGPGGQTTVSVVAAGIADAFESGEVVDTTELTGVDIDEPAPGSGANAEDPACSGALSTNLRAQIGVDVRNETQISWGFFNFDATIAAHITPRLTVAINDLSLSATCKKNLWTKKWKAWLPVGPITIPGYIKISSDIGVTAQVTALDLSASLSLPCRVGVRATKNSVTNISGCSALRSTITVTPKAEATLKAFADLKFGYFVGQDRWADTNIGLTIGPELGIELKASPLTNPYWTLKAYLDVNLDITGEFLGRWELNVNLANKRLYQRLLASGNQNQGTTSGGGTHHTNPDIATTTGPDPFLGGVTAITTDGGSSSCAVLAVGTVKCWGRNKSGQLGNGTMADSSVPVPVAGLTGATAITTSAAYQDNSYCALLAGGTAKCWGYNRNGQLGNGTTTDSPVPVVVTGLSGATAITTDGDQSFCALLNDGTAKCWGDNFNGQLGNGTGVDSSVPVTVTGLSGATAITANGGNSFCALLVDGTAKCWGRNNFGQLGNGTTTGSALPVTVTGLSGVTAITANRYYSYCALLGTGKAKCWGYNRYGQLGNGTTVDSRTPAAVAAVSGATAIFANGFGSYCAVLAGGTAKCWGYNGGGKLGNGTTTHSSTPVPVTGLTGAIAITGNGDASPLGAASSCALLISGAAMCWGTNGSGQLGDGTTTPSSVPVPVVGLSDATAITTDSNGRWHCALLIGGSVKCWGENLFGQLGAGTISLRSPLPLRVLIGLD